MHGYVYARATDCPAVSYYIPVYAFKDFDKLVRKQYDMH